MNRFKCVWIAIFLAGVGCDDGAVSTPADATIGDGGEVDRGPRAACGDGTVDDGEGCDDGNIEPGDGCDAECQVEPDPACGDGTIDDGEGCDDGNIEPGDGCDAACQVEPDPACGDGTVDDGEGCDDGNIEPGDGCDAECQVEPDPACGDGTVDDGEGCDDGNIEPGDGCDAECQVEPNPACGDGTIDDGEGCDDGNIEPGDGCDAACQVEPDPACGDGTVDDGEGCDDGNIEPGDGCDAACQVEPEPACGDGTVDDGEGCDDGNIEPGDGCDAECQVEPEPACGDGTVDDGEGCDDGNIEPGDGCDAECAIEPPLPVCGDGQVQGDEVCDDGNVDNGDGCDDACQVEIPGAECGNGALEDGEGCDDGNLDAGDGCDPVCMPELDCGNGLLNDDEQCDDGNVVDGDGCSAECRFEGCGDGQLVAPEQCDDGNRANNDGCAAECTFEGCGDGRIDAPEQCDDGDRINGDGCSALCRFEGCGDGRVAADEQCDDGNRGAGDGCSAECAFEGCGDGVVGANEQCDDGGRANNDGCSVECGFEGCGDGVVGANEQCDDGGRAEGDGCSARCRFEGCGDGALGDDEDCDDGNRAIGDGCAANCRFEGCGDGVVAGPEQCDDGGRVNSDGCSAACRFEGCGDGVLGADEQCDDGGRANGDGCSAACRFDGCGDGDRDPDEQCDDGNRADGDGCSPACAFEGCGDGRVEDREQCDDGGRDDGDGCSAGCRFEGCGDGVLGADEQCDDGDRDADDGCDADCGYEGCGDDVVDDDEDCDDGDRFVGDGCDASCRLEVCGNGVVGIDAGGGAEECDDGNLDPGDGCDAECDLESCGDGELDVGEQCDDGNRADGDGCSPACGFEGCGDGVLDAGEDCDDGNRLGSDGCDAACQFEGCGDGALELGEQCDDGNRDDGDTCDAQCRFLGCGDGGVEPGEQCDDGGRDDGDGCDAACRFEGCGDGAVVDPEQCDDGGRAGGDGCAADCRFEGCGDGAVDGAEECDDGARAPGDGCDAACQFEGCGDDVIGDAEQCDDGGRADGDGCSGECTFEGCGDGFLTDGEQCDDGGRADGDGCSAACTFEGCGDGAVEAPEQCDDGDRADGDGCSARCRFEGCGDGALTEGEQCDDGARNDGDGCTAGCRFEGCGDGAVGDDEDCDDGNRADRDGCSAGCRFEGCGDGAVAGGEDCDDGNREAGDGCSAGCVFEGCGDGELAAGEQCDDGNRSAGDGCAVNCQFEGCGDGALGEGEQCDDGNRAPGDGCDAVCQFEGCGDGALGEGEQCDDGDRDDADGCSAECQFEGCGDGALDAEEQCDDGNRGNGDGCSAACGFEGCGDGAVQRAEQCDDGDRIDGDGCTAACRFEGCGDGALDPGEQCDDGNRIDGDGCDDACQFDGCGDGVVDDPEVCDDGNRDPGDGCDAGCRVEICGNGVLGVDAAGDPEECDDGNLDIGDGCDERCSLESCGDGALDPGEQCDDGGRVDGDGCDLGCQFEGCGDGVIEAPEQCDDGGRDDGDGCTAACRFEGCGDGELALGEECDDGNRDAGDGCDARCNFVGCGDGELDPGEQCDDGGRADDDGCSAECRFEGCGDGVVGEAEECDDGNRGVGDGCGDACQFEGCGDGAVGPGEECDDDGRAVGDGCDAGCQFEGCGDDVLGDGEQCDDGGRAVGDGCDAACQFEGCGDADVGDGEQCDDGNRDDGDGCTAACAFEGCGDAVLDGDEQCDDGNRDDGDGCDPQCRFQGCGDGEVAAPEQCDDGNRDDGDGCDPRCRFQGCGDGQVDDGEQCDDGDRRADDGCDAACQFEGCGDGVLDPGEICDDGDRVADAVCSNRCTSALCGNGVVDEGEDCDDGGLANNDGCDAVCTLEDFEIVRGRRIVVSNGVAHRGRDRYRFTVDQDGSSLVAWVRDQAARCDGIGDSVIRVFTADADGNRQQQVAFNDDGANGFCPIVRRTDFLAAGDYVAEVLTKDTGLSQYRFDFALTVDIGAGGRFQGKTGRGETGGTDEYTFSIAGAPQHVRLSTSDGEGGCDVPAIQLYAERNGRTAEQLAIGRSTAEHPCPELRMELPVGDYQVRTAFRPVDYVMDVGFATCGDGVQQAIEQCDDGAREPGDGCDADCQFEGCGDGEIAAGEDCDDGNRVAGDDCDPACQFEGCGDGAVAPGEECDDGNRTNGDLCDAACRIEPGCGNGRLDDGEECELGPGCLPDCQRAPDCGDGFIDGPETCDDGNRANGDGCDSQCRVEVGVAVEIAAANGSVEVAGIIDDDSAGWDLPTEGCLAGDGAEHPYEVFNIVNRTGEVHLLRITASWAGDGFLHVFQAPFDPDDLGQCAFGNDDFGGPQASQLDLVPIAPDDVMVVIASSAVANQAIGGFNLRVLTYGDCGDGVVGSRPQGAPEQCDGGAGCDESCQFVGCGDGVVGDGEQCDEGDRAAGDGCSPACQFEGCGDGAVGPGEACDDGNRTDEDGCSATCRFEGCGDGVVGVGERCDDGNRVDGDGCSALCVSELCGNGQVNRLEECDDGGVANGDDCDAVCTFERIPITAALVRQHSLGMAEGSHDRFAITVDNDGGSLHLSLTDGLNQPCGILGDPVMRLYTADADGEPDVELVFDDDGGEGLCPLIQRDGDLPAGDYIIEVAPKIGSVGPYRLAVDQWTEVGDGGIYAGAFGDRGNDQFEFTLDAPRVLVAEPIALGGGCPTRTGMTLIGLAPERQVARISQLQDGPCPILRFAVAPGTYRVRVYSLLNVAAPQYAMHVRLAACGDGQVTAGEECDDGNQAASDGCSAVCTFEGCGDGVVEGEEACDDGNRAAGDGCSPECTLSRPLPCGDGRLDANEECDDGGLENGDGCDARCSHEAFTLIRGRHAQPSAGVAPGAVDRFRFTVDADGGVLDAQIRDPFGACDDIGDGVLRLLLQAEDGSEQAIATDDDSGLDLCPWLSRADLAAGDYVVEATGKANGLAGYTLHFAHTVDITGGGDFTGSFVRLGDDEFSFTLARPQRVSARTGNGAGGCGSDTVMYLHAADDLRELAFDDDGGALNCSRIEQDLPAGRYFLRASGDRGRAIGAYVLSLGPPGGDPVCGDGEVQPGEACDDGNLLDGDGCDALCTGEVYALIGAVESRVGGFGAGLSDTFEFTVDHSPSALRVSTGDGAGGCPGDTRIGVYRALADGERILIVADDDGGIDACSLLTPDLPAGSYVVVVDSPADQAVPAYTLDYRLETDVNGGGDFDGFVARSGSDRFTFDVEDISRVDLSVANRDNPAACGSVPSGVLYRLSDPLGPPAEVARFGRGCWTWRDVLPAGRYALETSGVADADSAPYRLSASFAADPVFELIRARASIPSAGLPPGGEARFAFTVDEDGSSLEVRVLDAAGRCTSASESVLRLSTADPDGAPLQELAVDAGGPGPCRQITRAGDLERGRYVLQLDAPEDDPLAAYALDYLLFRDVTVGTTFRGFYAPRGDDLFTLRLDAPARVRLRTSDGRDGCFPGVNAVLRLFGVDDFGRTDFTAAGQRVAPACSLLEQELAAGDYEVEVSGNNNNTGAYIFDLAWLDEELVCGDGRLQLDEQCDDGNVEPGDGCDADCGFEPVCGNGVVEEVEGHPTEDCDDGNVVNGDGCDALCTFEDFALIRGTEEVASQGVAEGSTDRYTFNVNANGSSLRAIVRADGGGCAGVGDPVMRLFTADDDGEPLEELAVDDNGGPGACPRIDRLDDLPGGDYVLEVEAQDGVGALGPYQLDFRLWKRVPQNATHPGGFVAGGDDRFIFESDTDVGFTLTARDDDCPGQRRGILRIGVSRVNPDGTLEAVSATNQGNNDVCTQLVESWVAPGRYEVTVTGEPNPDYTLQFSLTPRICGDGRVQGREQCDGGDNCDALCTRQVYTADAFRTRVWGRVPAGEDDAYRFEVVADSGFIEAIVGDGSPNGEGCDGVGDPMLELWRIVDGVRDRIASQNRNGGAGVCPRLSRSNLTPGIFELVVREQDGNRPLDGYALDLLIGADVPALDVIDTTARAAGADSGLSAFRFTLDAPISVQLFTGEEDRTCWPCDAVFSNCERRVELDLFAVGEQPWELERVQAGVDGTCAELTRALPAGTYVARVLPERAFSFHLTCLNCALPTPGRDELVITEIMTNTADSVIEANGEWFEVVNTTDRRLDLTGVRFLDDGGEAFTIPLGEQVVNGLTIEHRVIVQPGQYFVFGANADREVNGDVPVDYDYVRNEFWLGNGHDEIIIRNTNNGTVDAVRWDNGETFPDSSGYSMSLGTEFAPEELDNRDGSLWCNGYRRYSAGSFGTPGAPNLLCPGTIVEVERTVSRFSNNPEAVDAGTVTIPPGVIVRWTGAPNHNIVSAGEFRSGGGGTDDFQYRFNDPGNYPIRCDRHAHDNGGPDDAPSTGRVRVIER